MHCQAQGQFYELGVGGWSEAEAAIDEKAPMFAISQEGGVHMFVLAQGRFCLCLSTIKE